MNAALLLGASYYGTLAAARTLGAAGIEVYVGSSDNRGAALHSKFVHERVTHPDPEDVDKMIEWLVNFGRTHPHTVLYPTTDNFAWLFAKFHNVLQRHFCMFQPGEDVLLRLLDKVRLAEVCADVGIKTPPSWSIIDADGCMVPEPGARFPLLIKPRTQVFLSSGYKGGLVQDPEHFKTELLRFQSQTRLHPLLEREHPELVRPLLQEYLPVAETNILSVSGFVTQKGAFVTRASRKVLQRPRKIGIGLCFESCELDTSTKEKLLQLCVRAGYYGVFEAEFIVDHDDLLLIDFNPRYFSQMAFDAARGMPLALLAHYAASGDRQKLHIAISKAAVDGGKLLQGYSHSSMLRTLLVLQRLSGKLSRSEVRSWRRWTRMRAGALTDAVTLRGDMTPAIVDSVMWLVHFARHPRSFVRDFVLDR